MNPPARVIPLHEHPAAPPPGLSRRCDEELMQLAVAGVAPAFAQLVQRHQAKVRIFCARWCGDRALGDELAQEVFLDIWRSRGRYEPRGRFAAWLFTVARNRCRSERRRRPQADPRAEVEPPQAAQLEEILQAERQLRVDEQVRLLPDKLREALMLRFNAGLEYGEIARVVGTGESTARSRVFLALSHLREWAREAER